MERTSLESPLESIHDEETTPLVEKNEEPQNDIITKGISNDKYLGYEIINMIFAKTTHLQVVLTYTLDITNSWKKLLHKNNKINFYFSQASTHDEVDFSRLSYLKRSIKRSFVKPFYIPQGVVNMSKGCRVMNDCSKKSVLNTCRFNAVLRKYNCQVSLNHSTRISGKNVIETPFEFALKYGVSGVAIVRHKRAFLAVYDYLTLCKYCSFYSFQTVKELLTLFNVSSAADTEKDALEDFINELKNYATTLWNSLKQLVLYSVELSDDYSVRDQTTNQLKIELEKSIYKMELEEILIKNPLGFYFCEFYVKKYSDRFFTKDVAYLNYLKLNEKEGNIVRNFAYQYNNKTLTKKGRSQIIPMELTCVTKPLVYGNSSKGIFEFKQRMKTLKTNFVGDIITSEELFDLFHPNYPKSEKPEKPDRSKFTVSPIENLELYTLIKKSKQDTNDTNFEILKMDIHNSLNIARQKKIRKTVKNKQRLGTAATTAATTAAILLGGKSKKNKTTNRTTRRNRTKKKKKQKKQKMP